MTFPQSGFLTYGAAPHVRGKWRVACLTTEQLLRGAAAGRMAGRQGIVHEFEPFPQTHARLYRDIDLK